MKDKRTIMIVDDDSIVRHAVKAMLSKDFNIVQAGDYKEAIQVFNGNDVALAILDISLDDGRSGVDLLVELKKINTTLPVIMLSNSSDSETIVKCMKLGAYDYITKQNLTNYDELAIKTYNCFSKAIDNRIIKEYERFFDENHPIIFNSRVMQQILTDIQMADEMNILIEGETGATGHLFLFGWFAYVKTQVAERMFF